MSLVLLFSDRDHWSSVLTKDNVFTLDGIVDFISCVQASFISFIKFFYLIVCVLCRINVIIWSLLMLCETIYIYVYYIILDKCSVYIVI